MSATTVCEFCGKAIKATGGRDAGWQAVFAADDGSRECYVRANGASHKPGPLTWEFTVSMTWDPEMREWRGQVAPISEGTAEAWGQTLRSVTNHITTQIESTVLNDRPVASR